MKGNNGSYQGTTSVVPNNRHNFQRGFSREAPALKRLAK
jgi:hypothetical protein